MPLPMIDWLNPNNIGALQLSINYVVNIIRPPTCPIPPPSTMLLTASICLGRGRRQELKVVPRNRRRFLRQTSRFLRQTCRFLREPRGN